MTWAETEQTFVESISSLYEPEEARELFSIALQHVLNVGKAQVNIKKGEPISQMDETSLLQICGELKSGKPIQYILGETYFYGLKFKVNSSVLIPRPETEELVDWILKDVHRAPASLKILDIGTGSGCIPISLKKKLPQAKVWGLDVSHDALEVAIRNAVSNQAEVKFIHGDILSDDIQIDEKFDIIVSNPPYVKLSEKDSMHQNVLAHEPHLALFVEDDDALIFYRKIADFAFLHLNQGGKVFLEINEALGSETIALLKGKSFLNIEIRRDMQGKNRMVRAVF